MLLFLIILSILPSALILFYIYRRDKYEQEPLGLLLKSFGLGALSTICVIIAISLLELFIPTDPNTGNPFFDAFISAFLGAAIPEELMKFLMLYLLIWKNQNFSERFDGIIYAVFVSLGFATVENIVYVLQYGMDVALSRALTAVPAHALFGVSMGYYFSYAKFLPEYEKKYLSFSIGTPIVLHGMYNFLLISQSKFLDSHILISIILLLMFVAFVVFLWMQGFKKIKKMSSDFYFTGVPVHEVQEYVNAQTNETSTNVDISLLRGWYEVTPQIFELEKNAIMEKYPNAQLDISDNVLTFTLLSNFTHSWIVQLTYSRNYRKLKEQLRVYVIKPDLNELAVIANEIPYINADLSNSYYLDVSPCNPASGVKTIDNALMWIDMFEKWVNGDIELKDFVIN